MATALLPVLACFLGGATEKWAEGIIVALLGSFLLISPPRVSLGRAFNVVVLGLVACAALAFLPASWFIVPAWRTALVNDFAVKLPRMLSPQPWLTAGCFSSFIAGLAWLYHVSAQELENRNARRQLRIFASGVVGLAVASLILYFAKTSLPFWHNQRGFGPFPNRNQTADLLGITSVVIIACGYDDSRRGNKRWIFWLVGFVVALAAIVLNFSRAGIVIVVAGSALWLAVLLLRTGSTARIAAGVSAMLVLLTAMLLFGGQTLDRFHLRGAGAGSGGISSDFRWLIFRDAVELIRASPWSGIGLGNFSPVFAIFRHASVGQNRALHPESDWFWAGAELGWPGVILIVAGAALLASRVLPLDEGSNLRLRLGAFVAAVLFALHGLVDVSAHRVGSSYAGLFLFGLALRRPLAATRSNSVPVIFRGLGLVLIAIGGTWVISATRALPLPGGIGVDLERSLATEANKHRDFDRTIAHASRGLEWAPLDWQLYFVRAIAKVGANRPTSEALSDFRLARFLEPGSYEVPYQEGMTWITNQPVLAMTAWREALRRAGPDRPALYARMLSSSTQMSPAVNRMLQDFGNVQPDLALIYLERASREDFSSAIVRLLKHDPSLQSLTSEQKQQLFDLWVDRGDLEQLVSFASADEELLKFGWRGVAKQRAAEKDFRGAYEIAQRFNPRPKLPQVVRSESIEQLQQRLFASANDYEAGLALYEKQTQEGRLDDALITVRRVNEQDGAPAYFHLLEAESWAAKQNWERAWNAWEAFAAATLKR